MRYRGLSFMVVVVLGLVMGGCTSAKTVTVDKGRYTEGGQNYRHLTTTVTIERDPVCVASCLERP
jgi:hypothetical protein